MAKLIMIRGNSGSGKTTAAKALQRRFGPNTMLISHDMIRREMLNTGGAEGVRMSQPLMIRLLRYGRAHSEVTILEGILPAAHYGPLFAAASEEFGQQIFAFYYDLPFEETLRRHGTRPQCSEFGEAELRRWWLEKDLLPQIPETILSASLRLEEAVELIFARVTA